MKRIESVTVDEVIWRILSGHHGIEVIKQMNALIKHSPNLIVSPDFNNWEENMIRRGALSLCAGAGCPLTNLILRAGPKSSWDNELLFSRYSVSMTDFINFKEINYEKKLKNALEKYKDNVRVLKVRNSILNNTFDLKKLEGIILYKIKNDYIIIDGVHRAMGVMMTLGNTLFPELKVIILENEVEVKRKLFFFKKQYKI